MSSSYFKVITENFLDFNASIWQHSIYLLYTFFTFRKKSILKDNFGNEIFRQTHNSLHIYNYKNAAQNINKKTYLSLSFFLQKISFHTHDHELIDFHFKFSASSFQHVKACVIIFLVSISMSFNLLRTCLHITPSKYYQKGIDNISKR